MDEARKPCFVHNRFHRLPSGRWEALIGTITGPEITAAQDEPRRQRKQRAKHIGKPVYGTVRTGNLSREANLRNRFGMAPATSNTTYKIGRLVAPMPAAQCPGTPWSAQRYTLAP